LDFGGKHRSQEVLVSFGISENFKREG